VVGRRAVMKGLITSRDVVANLALIWSEFGLLCALKCVVALMRGKQTTFLDVALKKAIR
jgi:hypothetical protein